MRAVLQRVSRAEVRVDGERVAAIGHGVAILLGVVKGDGMDEVERMAKRVAELRLYADGEGRMNLTADQVGAACLVVSQITLAWDGRRGRRPSMDRAAEPSEARKLVDAFVGAVRARGVPCQTGRFGAQMEVELVNQGPITVVLEEPPRAGP